MGASKDKIFDATVVTTSENQNKMLLTHSNFNRKNVFLAVGAVFLAGIGLAFFLRRIRNGNSVSGSSVSVSVSGNSVIVEDRNVRLLHIAASTRTSITKISATSGEIVEIPYDYLDPITLEIMLEPVVTSAGNTYDRLSIEKWFALGRKTDPLTGIELQDTNLIRNWALQSKIRVFLESLSEKNRDIIIDRREKHIFGKLSGEVVVDLFFKVVTDLDKDALDVLTKEGFINFQEPLLASTMLHFCAQKIILLMNNFKKEMINRKSTVALKINQYSQTMLTLLDKGASLVLKNKNGKTPIDIMNKFCPIFLEEEIRDMKPNNEAFSECRDIILNCANKLCPCETKNLDNNQAVMIERKLNGQYAIDLLPASKKYIFWKHREKSKRPSLNIVATKLMRKYS